MFKYDIGDKVYIQKPLVLGQIRQLIDCLKGAEIRNFNPLEIFNQLKDRMPGLLAIILIEDGKSPRGKDLEGMAEEIEFSIDIDTGLTVIEDFFVCNPIASLKEKLEGMPIKILKQMPPPAQEGLRPGGTGLRSSPSSSPEETSPGETKSSGDTLPKNANPSPDI